MKNCKCEISILPLDTHSYHMSALTYLNFNKKMKTFNCKDYW